VAAPPELPAHPVAIWPCAIEERIEPRERGGVIALDRSAHLQLGWVQAAPALFASFFEPLASMATLDPSLNVKVTFECE
jgi:hypothetical protein